MVAPDPADQFVARWSKRALTYGATIATGLAAAVYFVLQTANRVALAPYGLDASGYSASIGEMIAGGISSILILFAVMSLLWWPISVPSSWIAGKIGTPAVVGKLEAWTRSDPASQRQRAITTGGAVIVSLLALILLWAGAAIEQWRVSNAEWIVSANGCAARCFSYSVEGRSAHVIGRPIAANATRMAIIVGHHKAELIALDKIISVEGYQGKPVTDLSRAPWKIRWGWWLLDIFNANW